MLRTQDDAVPFLTERLESQDKLEIGLALMTLAGMKGRADEIAPAILALTKNTDASIRGAAAMTLFDVGQSDAVLERLIELVDDESPAVRWKACNSLKGFGPAASKAVPALIQATTDPDSDVRDYAVIALGEIRSQPEVTIPALIRAVDTTPNTAAVALGKFGRDAAPAVPALVRKLEEIVAGESGLLTGSVIAETLVVTEDPRAKNALPAIEALLAKETADNIRDLLVNAIETIKSYE